VAKRAARSNRGSELGRFLDGFVRELEEDEAALEQVMRAVGARRNPLKRPAVLLAERIGRLKLNGQLRGYSDLSRVLELEGLQALVNATGALWRSLEQSGSSVPVNLEQLAERADRQRDDIERHRSDAARRAFRPS
jgi:hypothetical protein